MSWRYYLRRAFEESFAQLMQWLPRWVSRVATRWTRYSEGLIGTAWRNGCYRRLCRKVGRNLQVGPAVFIYAPENLILGDDVTFNPFSVISAAGGLHIGSQVAVGNNVSILTSNHVVDDPEHDIRHSGLELKPTTIGSDVWIGAGAVIVAGCNLADGVVIAAQSVVTRDVAPYAVVGGVPARILRYRKRGERSCS